MNGQHAIADLHCHYPMHLVPDDDKPPDGLNLCGRLLDFFRSKVVAVLARILNDFSVTSTWRVDTNGLKAGGVQLVCSVLYWPAAEFTLGGLKGARPGKRDFADIQYQLGCVEKDLNEQIAAGAPLLIAKRADDIARRDRTVFVHCVEGGFQLGPDVGALDEHVRWLADEGVYYITVAHLFYRCVASNAPALPFLTDAQYHDIFREPSQGLTELGEELIRAMYRHKVIIDISHMSEGAIDETFALVERLDAETGSDPLDYPLIACHVGMRSACPEQQEYNLTPETAKRIQARGGLIGLIMAQHQMGETRTEAESQQVLCKHIQAIAQLGNGHGATALGTDLDGFIKPTLAGIDRAADLAKLAGWIAGCAPNDVDAILCDNARRVIRRTFEVRAAAGPGGGRRPAPGSVL
jgi:membrane dipeptidase